MTRRWRITVALCMLLAFTVSEGMAQRRTRPIVQSDAKRAGRSMVMSQNGMVASAQPLASLAGVDILRAGGNAVDAAIATAAVLAVVEPHMTGLGGDMFMLYYDASTRRVYALNGSGRSPRNLPRSYFDEKENPEIEDNSWEAVTVPGAVDGWAQALNRFGTMTFDQVLRPAIRYCEEGFPVTEVVAAVWNVNAPNLRRDRWASEIYLVDNAAPDAGEIFRNPYLGQTLRHIAQGGRDAFYEGPIAQEIVRYAQETGGWLTVEDFAAHSSDWVEPITTNYRGYDVYQCPPNGQGIAVLTMLNILEGFDLAAVELNSPAYLHTLIEAKKLAYGAMREVVADPATTSVPVRELISKDFAADHRVRIDAARAAESVDVGDAFEGDTTCFVTIDKDGNAVSFINSLYAAFGSRIVGGRTGVKLQNRGGGFSLEEGHPNEYAPGKRPFHTIIPGMVMKDGAFYMGYGLMGGSMQPQGHVQFLLAHIDHGLTIQEAADMPRWRHYSGLDVRVERGFPQETVDALESLGHDVNWGNYSAFGGAQAVMIHPESGAYLAASDPRKDGAAIGY